MSCPPKRILPEGTRADPGRSRSSESAVSDFPDPQLSDDRERFFGIDVKGEVLHRIGGRETQGQVLDLEQGFNGHRSTGG